MTASVSPAEATVSYQWMQSSTKSEADGYTPIDGATQKTYTLKPSDVGKYVLCECKGTGKYGGTKRSTPTEAVKAKTTPVSGVTIGGDAKVGGTLTATVSPAGATVAYEWQTSDASGGEYSAIPSATSNTYQLQEQDLNKYIKVKVTGSGNYTGSVTSEASGPVAAAG